MNQNSMVLYNICKTLYQKLKREDFVIDKSGVKLVQLIATSFSLYPDLGHHIKIYNPKTNYLFKQTNEQYIQLQTEWHQSMQLNINMVNDVKIWQQVASTKGQINSNYGWCVFHPDNGSKGKSQFQHVVETLQKHQQSRQGLIIYTRPTMHTDSKRDGMSDFLCTISNQFFIRNDMLHMIYNMKGQDLYFGFPQNFAWACYVYNKMLKTLEKTYPNLSYGVIQWFTASLHLYERHFNKLQKLFQE